MFVCVCVRARARVCSVEITVSSRSVRCDRVSFFSFFCCLLSVFNYVQFSSLSHFCLEDCLSQILPIPPLPPVPLSALRLHGQVFFTVKETLYLTEHCSVNGAKIEISR